MAKHAARIVARQARDNVEAAKASYEKSIEDANDSFVDGLSEQFGLQAYTSLGGGGWTREAIIGSTLISGVITERQNLSAYERYRTQISTTTSLDEGTLESYDAAGVEMLVEKAMKELDGERVRIFGDGTETAVMDGKVYDSTYTDPDAPADERNFLEKAWDKVVETFSAKDTSANRTVKISLGSGEFTAHIGYTPVLKQVIDPEESYASNVLVSGSGQLGRIMGYFEYYQARQGKGYSEVKKPMYDKRIWNDEGSFVKSPTIKSTVNMGVSIAAMGLGPWAAMAVNLADDAVFTALDVSGGYKSAEQGALDFGKQAISSVATTALGGAFGGIKADGLIANTLLTGAKTFTTNAVTSGINAFELGKDGSLTWNDNAFLEGTLGKGAMASYASGMASTFTAGALNASLSDADRKFYAGAVGLASAGAGELARYGTYLGAEYLGGGGGDFGAAAQRAFDGMDGITVNALNLGSMLDFVASVDASNNTTGQSGLSGIAQKLSGAGLLELHIGSSGLSASMGSGGIDIGGNLYRLGKGMTDKAIIESYIAQDAKKGAIALNAYTYGDWNAETTARRLGTGKDELTLLGGDSLTIATDAKAQTVQNGDGSGRQIYMRDSGSGEGDVLNMAVTLQHEAYRDGIVGPDNAAETYAAALAHTKMAIGMLGAGKDGFLDADLVRDITALRNGTFGQHVATSYDSSADYWKLTKDGKLHYDGKTDLFGENGELLMKGVDGDMRGSFDLFTTGMYRGLSDSEYGKLIDSAGSSGVAAHGLARNAYAMVDALNALKENDKVGGIAAAVLGAMQGASYKSVSEALASYDAIGSNFMAITMGRSYLPFAAKLAEEEKGLYGEFARQRAAEGLLTGWSQLAENNGILSSTFSEFHWTSSERGFFEQIAKYGAALSVGASNPFYNRIQNFAHTGYENTTAALRAEYTLDAQTFIMMAPMAPATDPRLDRSRTTGGARIGGARVDERDPATYSTYAGEWSLTVESGPILPKKLPGVSEGNHAIPQDLLRLMNPDLRRAVQGTRGDPNIWQLDKDFHQNFVHGDGVNYGNTGTGGAWNDWWRNKLNATGGGVNDIPASTWLQWRAESRDYLQSLWSSSLRLKP